MTDNSAVELLEPTTPFKSEVVFYKMLGIWTGDDYFLAKSSRTRSIVLAAIALGLTIFQLTAPLSVTSTDEFLEAITEVMGSLISFSKIIPVVYKRQNFINLIRETDELNKFSALTAEEARIHNDWQRLEDKLKKLLIRFYVLSIASMYGIAPIFRNRLPFLGLLPEILKISPWFYMTYLIQALVLISTSIGVISTDCFSITFICQICKHLELVDFSMKNLNRHNKANLSSMINKHARTLDYGQLICDSFTSVYVLQHLFISTFLCFASIVILNSPNPLLLIKLLVMCVLLGFTLLVICYVGETITAASLKIAGAIQSSNYESFLHDVPALRAVGFILCRAQKPLRIPFGLLDSLNLKFFSVTVNKLVSFFMVLRTTMDQ